MSIWSSLDPDITIPARDNYGTLLGDGTTHTIDVATSSMSTVIRLIVDEQGAEGDVVAGIEVFLSPDEAASLIANLQTAIDRTKEPT